MDAPDEQTITLADPSDALNFYPGCKLTLSAPSPWWRRLARWAWRALVGRRRPDPLLVVSAIDSRAGVLTVDVVPPLPQLTP